MKKILLILCVFFSLSVMAQDVIIMQNGDEIQCKLIEIGTEQIKYKRWSNQNGPTFVEDRDDVFMIKYGNGDKDVFGIKNVSQQNESSISVSGKTLPNLMYDRKSVSGLSSGGIVIPTVEAQSIMGNDWKEFDSLNKQRQKGKNLLTCGIISRTISIPLSVGAIVNGENPLYVMSLGLRMGGGALLATGIVNMARGQRGCKRLVKQHDSSAVGFNPEFDFGIGVNAMSFRMNF